MAIVKNSDYWKSRFEELEKTQYQFSEQYCRDLQKQFRMVQNDIQADIEKWYRRLADNNDISYAAAQRLLSKNELEEFHWLVQDYIKYGKNNGLNKQWTKQLENASAKVHISRLDAMKLQIQQHAERLFQEYEKGTSNFLAKSYSEQFYHTAYEIAKGTSVGSNLGKIDERKITAFLQKPWAQDGSNFSNRLWKNKEKLINTLHTELAQNIIRGSSPTQAIENIANTMNTSYKSAATLVLTESAAISSMATQDCYKELGLEQYEILVTLDNRTSEICRKMDGKIFSMKDYKVGLTAPPFHPRCRSTTIPVINEDFMAGEKRAARNEKTKKTYYIPGNIKYEGWFQKFVENRVEYMSNSFRPKYGIEKVVSLGNIKINTKQVRNSKFDLWTDITSSERDMAVKLVEKNMEEIQRFMPAEFSIPQIIITDFKGNGLNKNAIAGYNKVTNQIFINSYFKSSKAVIQYLSKQKGYFASTSKLAPYLHELGHKYHYDLINKIAKKYDVSYNKAKDMLETPIAEYITQNSVRNNDILEKDLGSYYAKVSYTGVNRMNEVMAEYMTVSERDTGIVKFIREHIEELLEHDALS